MNNSKNLTAIIDENLCIGCGKCINACPVDAIIGSQQWMHTVVDDSCIGCKLCIPPCPVDCIEIVARPATFTPEQQQARAKLAKERVQARKERLTRLAQQHSKELIKKSSAAPELKADIAATLARLKQQKGSDA